MALQHHFVVIVEDGKMSIDDDTTDHKFYDGSVWNTEIFDWEPNYDYGTENETARELLWNAINKENA
jgi:hypothetical protein